MGKPLKVEPESVFCAACQEKRVHTVAEWTEFHRYARHKFIKGQGLSHSELEEAASERKLAVSSPNVTP